MSSKSGAKGAILPTVNRNSYIICNNVTLLGAKNGPKNSQKDPKKGSPGGIQGLPGAGGHPEIFFLFFYFFVDIAPNHISLVFSDLQRSREHYGSIFVNKMHHMLLILSALGAFSPFFVKSNFEKKL